MSQIMPIDPLHSQMSHHMPNEPRRLLIVHHICNELPHAQMSHHMPKWATTCSVSHHMLSEPPHAQWATTFTDKLPHLQWATTSPVSYHIFNEPPKAVSTKNRIKTVPITVGAMQTHLPKNPFDPAMTDSVLINAKIHIIFGTMRKDVYNTLSLWCVRR